MKTEEIIQKENRDYYKNAESHVFQGGSTDGVYNPKVGSKCFGAIENNGEIIATYEAELDNVEKMVSITVKDYNPEYTKSIHKAWNFPTYMNFHSVRQNKEIHQLRLKIKEYVKENIDFLPKGWNNKTKIKYSELQLIDDKVQVLT